MASQGNRHPPALPTPGHPPAVTLRHRGHPAPRRARRHPGRRHLDIPEPRTTAGARNVTATTARQPDTEPGARAGPGRTAGAPENPRLSRHPPRIKAPWRGSQRLRRPTRKSVMVTLWLLFEHRFRKAAKSSQEHERTKAKPAYLKNTLHYQGFCGVLLGF